MFHASSFQIGDKVERRKRRIVSSPNDNIATSEYMQTELSQEFPSNALGWLPAGAEFEAGAHGRKPEL